MHSIYEEISNEYYDDAVKTIIELVNINSVYDESTATKEMPYGVGVNNALLKMKEIAERYGLKAEIVGGRCVEINIGSEGKEVGIFGHLDVVPTSGKWNHDPFDAVIKDEKIYGRGTSDDKGPLICSFFSVIGLIKKGLVKNYRIRIVAGGDEERGSSCLEYYFNEANKKPVDCGFTPDADFPLIYGEKGIINYSLTKEINLNGVISIEAGVAPNCVIDKFVVKLEDKTNFVKYLETKNYSYHLEGDDVVFDGISAHGSTPELGKNAGIAGFFALGEYLNNKDLLEIANLYNDYNGKNMDLCFETENMGITTYNVGIINYDGKKLSLIVNFRFPENVNVSTIMDQIQCKTSFKLEKLSESALLYFDPNSKMIQTLYNGYVEESGDTITKPMAIGGGTYAKEAKNIVAFGSKFPGKDDHIHEANEKIDLEDIKKSIQLYARAINDLGNMQ